MSKNLTIEKEQKDVDSIQTAWERYEHTEAWPGMVRYADSEEPGEVGEQDIGSG